MPFVLYFSIIGSSGNVWHFKVFCGEVVFLVAFFRSVFNLGFTCYHSNLRVMFVRKIWLNAALHIFIFTSSGDQKKKKKDRKQANVEGQERKMEMIGIHSDPTPDSWWYSGLGLVFGKILWWVTLFQEFEPLQKKKNEPLPSFISQWPFSMILFLTIFSLPLQAGWLLKSASPPTSWA